MGKRGEGHVRVLNGRTYRLVYDGPIQRLEHRVLTERVLGRPLDGRKEVVHHGDDDGLNNKPDNLTLMTAGDHVRLHRTGLRKPKKPTPAGTLIVTEAIAMREQGASLAAIGRHFGVTYQAVAWAFKKRSVPTHNLKKGVYTWPIDEAVELYLRGIRLWELSRKYNKEAATIRRGLILRGVYRVNK